MEEGRPKEDVNNQQQQDQQPRRLKPPAQSENSLQPPQQPQKCPRCDSQNTKFCYYNNYSLSQPRYFCKTCRRYWTQGGTLRNVPVGGGCRKGKRTKASSSSGENSRSEPSTAQQLQVPQNLTTMVRMVSGNSSIPTSQSIRNKDNLGLGPAANLPMNSYFSGGGFLSSLAAMQSLGRPQQAFNGGQFGGGASNLALLQGFNVPSFRSPQAQIQQQNEIYQMGNRDKNTETLFPSDQTLVQPTRPMGSWTQSFINHPNPSASTTSFWNSSTSSTSGGSSLNPNQWPDLPGYGPPP